MSWKLNNEVRQARLAGQLPGINFTEFAVLLIMSDTARGETRMASLSMTELTKLSGLERSTMWRAVKKLERLGYVRKRNRGNQYQTSRYEILPNADGANTALDNDEHVASDGVHVAPVQQAPPSEHVASDGVHVALATEHVALDASARCAGATHPGTSRVTIPNNNPGGVVAAQSNGTVPAVPDDDSSPQIHGYQFLLEPNPPDPWCHLHPGGTTKGCTLCGLRAKLTTAWYDFHKPSRLDLQMLKYRINAQEPSELFSGLFRTSSVLDGEVIEGDAS